MCRLIDILHTLILAGVIQEEIALMDLMNQNTVLHLSLFWLFVCYIRYLSITNWFHSLSARCSSPSPVIFLSRRTLTAPYGGSFTLSAIVDSIPDGHQVIWTKGENIIGQGSLRLSEDTRITLWVHHFVYEPRDDLQRIVWSIEYDFVILNLILDVQWSKLGWISPDSSRCNRCRWRSVHYHDRWIGSGRELPCKTPFLLQYSTVISQVSLGSDAVSSSSSGCPSGERACLSGHCLPVSSFCNRHIECPDGDDELHCTRTFIIYIHYVNSFLHLSFPCNHARPCNYVYLFISHRNVFIPFPSLSSLPLISYPLLSNR